jgi:hypothetical protein
MNLPPTLRAWIRRLSQPLPAATVVFAAGLACAAFAIGVNRIVASRPPVPIPVIASQGTRASPSATPKTPPTPTPTPAAAMQASCTGADQASGDLRGMVVVAPAQVSLTDGVTTLDAVIPAGAMVDGHSSDVHVFVNGAGGGSQPLHGTLVQPATICVQNGDQKLQIDVPSGAQVDGSASAGASGTQAQDIHFTIQQSSD